MKQTIVLTESDLKQKVLDIASKMLKEWASKYQCEEPYYKFKDSVDELIDAFYQDFDVDNSEEIKNAVDYIVDYRRDETGPAKPSSIIKLGKGGTVKVIRE